MWRTGVNRNESSTDQGQLKGMASARKTVNNGWLKQAFYLRQAPSHQSLV